jgi:hypothetical protein
MNRVTISGFVAVALFAAATALLRSHSLSGYAAGTTGTASSKQHHGRPTSTDVAGLFDRTQALKQAERSPAYLVP